MEQEIGVGFDKEQKESSFGWDVCCGWSALRREFSLFRILKVYLYFFFLLCVIRLTGVKGWTKKRKGKKI